MDRYPTFAHSGIVQPCQRVQEGKWFEGGRILLLHVLDKSRLYRRIAPFVFDLN